MSGREIISLSSVVGASKVGKVITGAPARIIASASNPKTPSLEVTENEVIVSVPIQFNLGQGTGAQDLTAQDCLEIAEELEKIVDSGIESVAPPSRPVEVMRSTVAIDEDEVIHFMTVAGTRGKKPALVHISEAREVAEALRSAAAVINNMPKRFAKEFAPYIKAQRDRLAQARAALEAAEAALNAAESEDTGEGVNEDNTAENVG